MLTNYLTNTPAVSDDAFVADNAVVAGKVTVEKGASVWYGAVVRGDIAPVTIGKNSNIQDNAVIHTGLKTPVVIGEGVTVGHSAVIHGCTIEDNALIGMGAIVLDGAVIGKNSIIGAGAVVTSGCVIPAGSVALGTPAKVVKTASPQQILTNKLNALEYVKLARDYKK